MRGKSDPLGKVLAQLGVLDEDSIQDVLMEQRQTLPFASLCYVLGHCSEDVLARALSKKLGIPGIALDSSVIGLSVLDGIDPELSFTYNILPVYEDERRLFVAVEEPQAVASVLREIAFMRGRTVVPHVAIHITLARTIRACHRARQRGDAMVYGPLVAHEVSTPWMAVVSEVEMREESRFDEQTDEDAAAARSVVIEDVTKEVEVDELLSIQELGTDVDVEIDESTSRRSPADVEPSVDVLDLTGADRASLGDGPPRILIVDDDFASRHLLVKELTPEGYVTYTASSGGEAVRLLKSNPPDAVVLDVMLPEIDGFQICRAIKQSHRYQHIPVVLMSAVIDSGRVTDKVLRQYGADAYFEKPLNTDMVKARLRDLVGQSTLVDTGGPRDATFSRALELYRCGDIDGAIEELRRGLEDDPLSAKHHFVLANLLQKQELIYEAIDEYEATVDLRPDYFPALTRLAYLYYKKGFSAKAIETWRRSLPFCNDESLRENIELFMRKLIADMQPSPP